MDRINKEPGLSFLAQCTPHMSSFIKARVLQDMLHGMDNANDSLMNGLAVAMELGLPSLQEEASKLMENNLRSGRGTSAISDNKWKVLFETPQQRSGFTVTGVEVLGRKWHLYDFGDTIPATPSDPINDAFQSVLSERNQRLSIHLAAGLQHNANWDQFPTPAQVFSRARELRWEQYNQALECMKGTLPVGEVDPLVLVELRTHAHDALHPHRDSDRRSLICFAPKALDEVNVCVIRVSPSCRFTTHVISAVSRADSWVCLLAHHQHMRLAIPVDKACINDLVSSPQSVAQPVGWKSLMELGPLEATIATKCLSRCPHCQMAGIRLPMGIEGAMVGRSALMSEYHLREFTIEKPWTEDLAKGLGAQAHEAWLSEQATPKLDEPPKLTTEQTLLLKQYLGCVPAEDSPFCWETWNRIAACGDLFILSVGCMYKSAHCYTSEWRSARAPTTLLPGCLDIFCGRVQPELLEYIGDVATYGVRPKSLYPPVRNEQQPYSSVRDNPIRTAQDLWGDVVKGRILLFTHACEHTLGPLMESRLAFVTQKDITKPEGQKVRYISDPRVEINERCEPKLHPRVRVPQHGHVIRRVLYRKRRYPAIPVLLCKRDVKGAFKLLPVSIVGLAHMGVRFAEYMIVYLSLFFGWKPSPASWGIISSLLLQFVASFIPRDKYAMGPEGFRAYEYVDDGAFAEPWLDTRPWTSVRIWEAGLQSCLGAKALHEDKKKAEGTCATRLTLWGLVVCTESETLSLPEPKLRTAQEFLSQSYFDPGVTRIPLGTIQELRGKAEHWSLCNASLGPELHVIDRLLCSYRGLSQPRGDEPKLKQLYYDFWDTMETIRVNMSDSRWWSTTYTTSFHNILSLQERLSFQPTRSAMMWLGSDATLQGCAAVNHTLKTFTVFRSTDYIDFLSDLTGLPRGDYELIAITEYLSFICFVVAQAPVLKGFFVRYVGGNQNVANWIKYKRPGNRVAKYFTRILSRLESEWGFAISPMYISPANNVLQDELSRLDTTEAIAHGQDLGFDYVNVSGATQHYFRQRLAEFAIILPTDNEERARSIMQYVEKRIVRHIPHSQLCGVSVCYLGRGATGWSSVRGNNRLSSVQRTCLHWPSECELLGLEIPQVPNFLTGCSVCIGTVPHLPRDHKFFAAVLAELNPMLMVVDCHPSLKFGTNTLPWLGKGRRHWSWVVSTASFGEPQARDRRIHVSTRMQGTCADTMSPMFIIDVNLPSVLSEYLRSDESFYRLEGEFCVNRVGPGDIYQPAQLGWVTLPKNKLTVGGKVTAGGMSGVIVELSNTNATIETKTSTIIVSPQECVSVPTKYQVFPQEGIIFPIGLPYPPSGMGHTIFYDVSNKQIRPLSVLECWLVVGGCESEYYQLNEDFAKLAILNGTSPTMQLMLIQVSLGFMGTVISQEDRTGSVFHGTDVCVQLSPSLRMPAPRKAPTSRQRRRSFDLAAQRTPNRLMNISKFLTRVIRHGFRPDDGPEIEMSAKRMARMQDVVAHPTMVELACTEADLHVLANDVSPDHKKRLKIAYDTTLSCYTIGCYNGHSEPVENGDDRTLIRRPTYFVHGTTWEASKSILRQGLNAQNRQEIHMVPLHMNLRQESYIRNDARKTHLLVIDGAVASAAGITFYRLENDVIVSRGINGKIPPCCITSIWSNRANVPQCLNLEAALLAEPVETPTRNMPEHGPPLRVRGCVPSDEVLNDEIVPVTSKAVTLTPRKTPPRDGSASTMPELPPLSKTHVAPKTSSANSPTPSQLSLPENERPPSWETPPTLEPVRKTTDQSIPAYQHWTTPPKNTGQVITPEAAFTLPPTPPSTRAALVGINQFPGFTQPAITQQFRPPTSAEPSGSSSTAGIQPDGTRATPYPSTEPTLTLSQVERLIETKMSQFKAPPPPAPIRPRPPLQHEYHPYPSLQYAQQYQYPIVRDYQAGYVPIMNPPAQQPVPTMAEEVSADIDTICEQIGVTPSASFDQYLQRVRDFDKHPGLGGWHPRPPPTPLDPAEQARLPRDRQIKNEANYKSRVRRANIPHSKQKEDAWKVLTRKAWEAAQVIGCWCRILWLFFIFVRFLWNIFMTSLFLWNEMLMMWRRIFPYFVSFFSSCGTSY